MKISANKAVELLKKLGLQDVELVDDENIDFSEDDIINAIDNNRTPVIRTKIEQTLRDEITNRVTGTAGDKLRKALKDLTGIPAAELKDLDDRSAVEKAIKHYTATLEGDAQANRAKIDEIIAAHNKTLADKEAEFNGRLTEMHRKIADRTINEQIAAALKDAPFPEGADRNMLASLYKAHLERIYDLDIDEKENKVLLLDKNTKTVALTSDKNHVASIADHREDFFKPLGVWKTDLRDVNAPTGGEPYKPTKPTDTSTGGKDPLRESAMSFADRFGK